MLRVAFESKRLLSSLTGFGTYSRTLLYDLLEYFPKNEYLLVAHESKRELSRQKEYHSIEIGRVINRVDVRIQYPSSVMKLPWKLVGARLALKHHNINLYHGLAHQIPRSVRLRKIPKIVSIHDVIYRRYPEFCPGEDLARYDRELQDVCDVADLIIAVSKNTKEDILTFFKVDPDKIKVLYSASDRRYKNLVSSPRKKLIREKYSLPEKYFLYVGSIGKRKNVLAILRALRRLPDKMRLPLVIIGAPTAYKNELVEYAQENRLDDSLIFPVGVSTDDLPSVYQGAELFLYLSLYEGFGMPILEALCSNVPVITSNVSAMPEAAGSSKSLVDPTNADEIASRIIDIMSSDELRNKMLEDGRAFCRKFENRKITEEMVGVYQKLVCNEY